jgi:hypothetical protein
MAKKAAAVAQPATRYLQKLYVILHIRRIHHVVDEHQAANDVSDWRLLTGIDDTGVERDQLSHLKSQARTNASLDGVRARKASTKRSLRRIDWSISC